jgi:hypothetical protein
VLKAAAGALSATRSRRCNSPPQICRASFGDPASTIGMHRLGDWIGPFKDHLELCHRYTSHSSPEIGACEALL